MGDRLTNLAVQDGRQAFHLIDSIEILECTRREEECVAFLQRHGAAKLRLVVVVAQVSDLVEITAKQAQQQLDCQARPHHSLATTVTEGLLIDVNTSNI